MPAPKRYRTFELEIEPGAESYRARVLVSPAGETEGSFAFPFSQEEWEGLAAFPSEEVGARIFDALFAGPVAEAWRSSLARLHPDEGLRLNLRLPDAPELAALPWELLYDSTHQHFLALDERTPVNRYLSLPLAQEEMLVEPPLRVLVILSAPTDHEPLLAVEEEWQRIQTALAPVIATKQIELERLAKATWDELQSQLRKQSFHILHFVGHGLFDSQQGNGGLLFEDEEGFTQLISARKLAHLLRNHPSLRLALLNACEGAVSAADNPFAGVAQALVQQGIPAVIAMQQAISDRAALTFGPTFYAAVADGYPVDAALTQARMAVYAENDWEWATPVLFSRSADNHILVLPTTDATKGAAAATPAPSVAQIDTQGGAYVGEGVNISHGDFVGRDQIKIVVQTPGEAFDLLERRDEQAALLQPEIERKPFEPVTLLIPAGPFVMGEDPQSRLTLPPFRLGKYPITNREYAVFLAHTPAQDVPPKLGWFNRLPPSDRLDHPVTGVSWEDACAYCGWLSSETGRAYRLPSEAEWEKGARGLDGRAYPWGNSWADNCAQVGSDETSPVAAHPAGASPFGCEDLLGNVQEWTLTRWGPDRNTSAFPLIPYRPDDGREDTAPHTQRDLRIHRGGSFRNSAAEVHATTRGSASPDSRIRWRGFRVVLQVD